MSQQLEVAKLPEREGPGRQAGSGARALANFFGRNETVHQSSTMRGDQGTST